LTPALLSLLLAFPFPSGWDQRLSRRPGEPVAACAHGVPDSTKERFFGALQQTLGRDVPCLLLDACDPASMAQARRAGAEFLVALSPESLALWRVDPGLWASEPERPVLVQTTAIDRPRARLVWGRPRRTQRLDEPAFALADCRGRLYAVHRDAVQRLSDGRRLGLEPLRRKARIRAGVAEATCTDDGMVVAHGDHQRSGVVDLDAFVWRDFSNGHRWAKGPAGWLVARSEAGTNRFAAEVTIRGSFRSRSLSWAPWVDAAALGSDFLWVDVEGRLHLDDDVLPVRVGRGLEVVSGPPRHILASSTAREEDAVLVLEPSGGLVDRIPFPGAIRDLALSANALHVLTDVDGGSEIWRVGVEGLP